MVILTTPSVTTASANLLPMHPPAPPPLTMVLHMLSGFEIMIPFEENENGIDIYNLRNEVRNFLIKKKKLQYPYDDVINFIRSEENVAKSFVSLDESPITIVISKNTDHNLDLYYCHQHYQ